LDFPVPELTLERTELSDIHRDENKDEWDNTTITAESDKSQNWWPIIEILFDAVTDVINGSADRTKTESKEIKNETDDERLATVKICIETRD
jgi:hypothetical protein